MMIGASMDSIAMVEGEMKEISETEMRRIKFAHEHQSHSAQLRLQAAFGKKRSSYLRRRKDEFTLSEQHLDKIYAVAKAGSAKRVTSAFAVKES
jgi:polyribonucleotide nucleotidyltransferase